MRSCGDGSKACKVESDHQLLSMPRDLELELSIPAVVTAKLEIVTIGRNSQALPVNREKSDKFSGLDDLLDITSRAAARLRKHYLDRNSVHVTEDLIGCSSTSEVFRGFYDGRGVAVKRLRMNVIRGQTDAKELKDIMTEIDLMCRFLLLCHRQHYLIVILEREAISKSY